MNTKYSDKEKYEVAELYFSGISVKDITNKTNIPRSTVYNIIKMAKDTKTSSIAKIDFRKYKHMEQRIGKLEEMVEVLQSINCTALSPLKEKLTVLEELHKNHSIHLICDALKVSRGTFYNHIYRNKRDNTWYAKRKENLRVQIEQIYYDSNQIFGAAKIAAI